MGKRRLRIVFCMQYASGSAPRTRPRPAHRPRARSLVTIGVTAALSTGALAACGSSKTTRSTGAPAAAAAPTSPGATKSLAAPGTTIPAATVNYGIAPYEDDALSAAGILQGFYKDVGNTTCPTQTAAHVPCTQPLAPLLTNQVAVCSGVYESLLPQTATVKNVKTFAYYSTFNYSGFFVKSSENMKSLGDLLGQHVPFDQALQQTLAQLKGKTVVLSNDPSERQFFTLVFQLAGITNPSSY